MDSLARPSKRAPKPRKPISRGSRPARVRNTKRGAERESLDRLWSQLVKARHPLCGFQFRCSGALTVDPAHIFGKGAYPRLRWLALNGIGACRRCHDYYDHTMTRQQRATWAIHVLGGHTVQDLMTLHINGPSLSREQLRDALTAQLRRIAA